MKSNLISKSETSALLKTVSEQWGIEFPKIKNLKVHQILDDAQIITGKGIHSKSGSGVLAKEVHRYIQSRYQPYIQKIDSSPSEVMVNNLPIKGSFFVWLKLVDFGDFFQAQI